MENCLLYGKRIPCRILRTRQLLQWCIVLFLALIATTSYAQRTVTGQVASADSALAGVTVQVKGSNVTTQTDASGRFSINAPNNSTLIFSSVGFAPKEMRVGNQSSVSVNLVATTQQLEQVVVVGYGTQRK